MKALIHNGTGAPILVNRPKPEITDPKDSSIKWAIRL